MKSSLFLVMLISFCACDSMMVQVSNPPTSNTDATQDSSKNEPETNAQQKPPVPIPSNPSKSEVPCEWTLIYEDKDQDGYGNDAVSIKHCVNDPIGEGWSKKGGDCDDANPLTHPNAGEACNKGDDDCDGLIDEEATVGYSSGGVTTYKKYGPEYCEKYFKDQAAKGPDKDSDGFGTASDCNDNNPNIHPGIVEICNDIDDDCDGKTDEDCPPEGAVVPKGICQGSVLFVPYNCATIQAAVNAAPSGAACPSNTKVYSTNIFVQAGIYTEGVLVSQNRHVKIQRSGDNGQVIVDGGMQHAFQINECSSLSLDTITIENSQNSETHQYPSTVFVNLGGAIEINHCEIYTHSIGVFTGYSWWTIVTDTIISGITADSKYKTTGLSLSFEAPSTNTQGPQIYKNDFQYLSIGIQSCSADMPKLSQTSGDSNTYAPYVETSVLHNNFNGCIFKNN